MARKPVDPVFAQHRIPHEHPFNKEMEQGTGEKQEKRNSHRSPGYRIEEGRSTAQDDDDVSEVAPVEDRVLKCGFHPVYM